MTDSEPTAVAESKQQSVLSVGLVVDLSVRTLWAASVQTGDRAHLNNSTVLLGGTVNFFRVFMLRGGLLVRGSTTLLRRIVEDRQVVVDFRRHERIRLQNAKYLYLAKGPPDHLSLHVLASLWETCRGGCLEPSQTTSPLRRGRAQRPNQSIHDIIYVQCDGT